MKEKSVVEFELDSSRVGYDSKALNRNELNTEIFWHRKKTDNPNIFIMVSWKKGNIDVKGGRVEDTAYQREIKELQFKKKKKKSWNIRGKNKQWKRGLWNFEGYIKIQEEYLRYDSQTWLSNIDYHIHISSLVGWVVGFVCWLIGYTIMWVSWISTNSKWQITRTFKSKKTRKDWRLYIITLGFPLS